MHAPRFSARVDCILGKHTESFKMLKRVEAFEQPDDGSSIAVLDGRMRIPALTGMRFFAALMILAHHAAVPYVVNRQMLSVIGAFGMLAMPLFFTLSGYVMWLNYSKLFASRNVSYACRRFFSARVARLAPMYLVVMAIGCVTFPTERLWDELSPMLLWPLFLQSLFPNYGDEIVSLVVPPIGHLWSVSVEMVLYVFFPFIAVSLSKFSKKGLLSISAVNIALLAVVFVVLSFVASTATVGRLSNPDFGRYLLYYSPITHIFEFLAGCAAAALSEQRRAVTTSMRSGAFAVWALLAATFLLAWIYQATAYELIPASFPHIVPYVSVPIAALIACLIYYICTTKQTITSSLSHPLIIYGGELSYSIYLLHPLFVDYLRQLLGERPRPVWVALVIIVAIAATSIAFSVGSYKWIEKPGKKLVLRALSHPWTWRIFASGFPILAILATAYYVSSDRIFPHYETRQNDLKAIKVAMEKYHDDHGAYPITLNGGQKVDFQGYLRNKAGRSWLPQLVPQYLNRAPLDPRSSSVLNAQYVLQSDGKDFKVISLQPEDCLFTIGRHPELSDPARNTASNCQSYGYWTGGAKSW